MTLAHLHPHLGTATQYAHAMDDTEEIPEDDDTREAQDRIEELEAEVERLREALEEISQKAFPVDGPYTIAHIDALKEIADNALDEAEDGSDE